MSRRFQGATDRLLILLFLFTLPLVGLGQGQYLNTFFDVEDHHGNFQTWDIAQGKNGLLYFAQSNGLKEFDGNQWRYLWAYPKVAFSLGVRSDGVLFLGGMNEFGFLKEGDDGEWEFENLRESLDTSFKDFGRVSSVMIEGEMVWFLSGDFLFRYDGDSVEAFPIESASLRSTLLNGVPYFYQRGTGLSRLVENEIEVIPGSEGILDDQVFAVFVQPDSTLLVGFARNGMYEYDPESNGPQAFRPRPFEDWEVIKEGIPYSADFIPGGGLAISSVKGGVYLTDASGKIQDILDRDNGYQDNLVLSVEYLPGDGLWFGNVKGIYHTELHGPFRDWKVRMEIEDGFSDVVEYGGMQYFCGLQNIYYAEDGRLKSFGEEQIYQPIGMSLLYHDQGQDSSLLVSTSNGLFQVVEQRELKKVNEFGFSHDGMVQIDKTSDYGWGGGYPGLSLFRFDGNTFEIVRTVDDSPGIFECLYHDGALWARSRNSEIHRFTLSPKDPTVITNHEILDSAKGVDEFDVLELVKANDQIMVTWEGSMMRLDPASQLWVEEPFLDSLVKEDPGPFVDLWELSDGTIWAVKNTEPKNVIHKFIPEVTGYRLQLPPLPRFPERSVRGLSQTSSGDIWIYSGDGLYQYLEQPATDYSPQWDVLIRQVSLDGDSVVFTGNGSWEADKSFPYEWNSLRVEFSLPTSGAATLTTFSYNLEGLGKGWSDWSAQPYADLDNLPFGSYTFQVKARNAFGMETEVTEMSFSIGRPWYISNLAILAYVLLLLFLLWLAGRIARNRQLKKTAELEKIVAARTSELQQALEEVQLSRNEAEEATRAKSAFLANMTHEIRTPINGVIGVTDILRYTDPTEEQEEYIRTIRRSGENLLRIVNEILDFSKIEAGKMELDKEEFSLSELTDEIMDLFASQRSDKNLDLACLIEQGVPGRVKGDPHKLRQVLINLIGNAMKFTENGGVFVRVGEVNSAEEGESLRLRIEVEDTGIGISEEQRQRLFKEFGQADAGIAKKFGGTGLGLTISAKLVELMGGKLQLESEFGKGTTFFFEFEPERVEKAEAPSPSKAWQGKQALVLEKGIFSQRVLGQWFSDLGMEAEFTEDYDAILKALQEKDIDLLMIGIENGITSQTELLEYIREHKVSKGYKVVFIGTMAKVSRHKELQPIRDAILTKPLKVSAFHRLFEKMDTVGPVAVKKPAPKPVEEKEDLAASLPLRIIVADDDDINQMIALRMFHNLGFNPAIAGNGKEVLDLASNGTYDLIFMDVNMPEMDGIEATKEIHRRFEKGNRPTIIAMTANAMEGDRDSCLKAGMDDYMSKPFRIDELRTILIKYGGGLG